MIKCIFTSQKDPCQEANKFIISHNNQPAAFCDTCYKGLLSLSASKEREITQEQYLNYQILK